ncbi:MAG: hypothetical protein ACWA44_01700 [Thiotrichales bacterium]
MAKPADTPRQEPEPGDFETPAWLLFGGGGIPGRLRYSNHRLSFFANGVGNVGQYRLAKFGEKIRNRGLPSLLDMGNDVEIFSVATSTKNIKFPWYYFSGGLVVKDRRLTFKIGFAPPPEMKLVWIDGEYRHSAEGLKNFGHAINARKTGKQWKKILLH